MIRRTNQSWKVEQTEGADYSIVLKMMKLSGGFTPRQRVALLESGRLFKVQP